MVSRAEAQAPRRTIRRGPRFIRRFLFASAERRLEARVIRLRDRRMRNGSSKSGLWIEALSGSTLAAVRRRHSYSDMPPGPRRVASAGSGLVNIALWVTAILGTLTLGITIVAATTGIRPVIVRSGSMSPSIPVGSVLLAREANLQDLRAGDVISISRPDDVRVTHRIVEITVYGDQADVVLKGDANESPDAPIRITTAHLMIAAAPSIMGRVATLAATPLGGFILGVVIAAGLLFPLLRSKRTTAGPGASPMQDPNFVPEQHRPEAERIPRRWIDSAVRALLVVILATVMGLAFLAAGGFRILVVKSDSMAPALKAGDVVVSRMVHPEELAVGDVVTFRDPSRARHLLTHRVREVEVGENSYGFVTQGDANTGAERWELPTDGKLGVLELRIPRVGSAVAALTSPIARLILLALALLSLAGVIVRAIRPGPRNLEHPAHVNRDVRRATVRRAIPALTVWTLGLVLLPHLVMSTHAGFSSTATSSSNVFSTSSCFSPIPVSMTNFQFTPGAITIERGCSVTWTNNAQGTKHTSTMDGIWDSGMLSSGQSFTRVFDTTGTFSYECKVHPAQMQATVNVI